MRSESTAEVTRPLGRPLNVDVYHPEGDGAHAAIVLIHGGGWSRGHRKSMASYGHNLAAQGFVAIAAEYRLLGEAAWPAQLDDVRDVIRWTKEAANQLQIDPEKIVLVGFSAGGHLALLAAGTAAGLSRVEGTREASGTTVAAVVSFFAPTNLTNTSWPSRQGPIEQLLGDSDEAVAREASPIFHVHRAFPPTFLLSGLSDPVLPYQQALKMFDALLGAGSRAEIHLLDGQSHEFSVLPSVLGPVIDEVVFFIRRVVTESDRIELENLELNPFARSSDPE